MTQAGSTLQSTSAPRLVEVDALRGLAAIAVVLFHYTTRFEALFAPTTVPSFALAWGHRGVNLFFIISGFVIFMTLERTRQPMDFVVSRFSRLFPAYWLAIVLTFAITHLLGLPIKLVDWRAAIANVVMLHNLVGVPHVDGVYWTLEVELLFYAGMFALYKTGRLDQIHLALRALLALAVVYHLAQVWTGVNLMPWMVYRLLILQYLPWFCLGIAVYVGLHPRNAQAKRQAGLTALAAMGTLALVESAWIGVLALALTSLVWLAASGRAAPLRWQVLVWLGGISYPLYLLHENIGWSLLLRLHALGVGPDLSVALVVMAVLLLSHAAHRSVELPAMRWIRRRWRERQNLA